MRKPQPTDPFFEAYAVAAGRGSLLELRMRLLVDNTPALQRFAHAEKLVDVESALMQEFAQHLSSADCELLASCRQLRNKIMHCDFRAARAKVLAMGGAVSPGGVWKGELASGEVKRITETTTAEGRVIGWVLECATGGAFAEAKLVFERAIELLERLRDLEEDAT